jgi:hypothetical protein
MCQSLLAAVEPKPSKLIMWASFQEGDQEIALLCAVILLRSLSFVTPMKVNLAENFGIKSRHPRSQVNDKKHF